jgi:hypothetical protein
MLEASGGRSDHCLSPASEASAEPYAPDRVEPSVLNRAFCSSLRPLQKFVSAGCTALTASSRASRRFSIASTRPVGVSDSGAVEPRRTSLDGFHCSWLSKFDDRREPLREGSRVTGILVVRRHDPAAPTPAAPDSSPPWIRLIGASPSIQLASTSDIPSRRICVFRIRMLGGRCGKCACGGSSFISCLASSFSHLNSDFGGIGPSRLNQQRLPSMSRHHQ